jgi:hypothetical protein
MTILFFRLLHILLLNRLPFVGDPELYLYPYLTTAGLLPYRQIVDQHFPGLFFFPVNFLTLGFSDPLSFKTLLWVLLILQSVLIYKIARKYFTSSTAVWAVILFSVWQPLFDGHHLWIDTILPVLTLSALYFWLGRQYFRAGLFLGLAMLFKQTVIVPIIILGLYLLIKNRKSFINFVSPPIIINLLIFVYFWSQNSLKDFIFWTIQFNLTSYTQAAGGLVFPKWLILFGVLTLIAIFTQLNNSRIRWISLWAGLFLAGSLTRMDLVHWHSIIPFLFIILGYFLSRLPRTLLLISGIFLVLFPLIKILSKLPSGDYRYFDAPTLQTVDLIKSVTHPGDHIFLLGAQPHIYALTQTLPPGDYFSYQLPWYLPLTQSKILATLRVLSPHYIVFDPTAQIDDQTILSYAPALINFLFTNYSEVQTFGNLKIYNKTP